MLRGLAVVTQLVLGFVDGLADLALENLGRCRGRVGLRRLRVGLGLLALARTILVLTTTLLLLFNPVVVRPLRLIALRVALGDLACLLTSLVVSLIRGVAS